MNRTESSEPKPRISVIIPAYNEEKYLGDTLESVQWAADEYLKRHGSAVEVIVVNNNSSDRTEEVARRHGARVVFESINNISAARNAGARAAQGEVFAFLDADDHMSPNFLSLVDAAMNSGECIGGGATILWNKRSIWVIFFNALGNSLRRFFGVSNALLFTSREIFDSLNGFDEQYYAGEDMKFAVALRRLGKKEGKNFCVIRDGYVLKSARKFDRYGGIVILFGFCIFLFVPWLVKSKKACFFWYNAEK